MDGFLISPETRSRYAPTPGLLNISMDFNAAPSGAARGTEVIVPDNASPAVRAAAERYNQQVADFARRYGISDYPVRGVKTRSENGRGVPHTVHVEPFFNSDRAMQEAIKNNPAEFAEIYRAAFGTLPNARLIAPHGVGKDRGAASDIFGSETDFGMLMANTLLGGSYESPEPGPNQDIADAAMAAIGKGQPAERQPAISSSGGQMSLLGSEGNDTMTPIQPEPEQGGLLFNMLGPKAQEWLTPERVAYLQMALEGMSLRPNQGIMKAAEATIHSSADRRKANRTAEWLASRGRDDLAQAVASGAVDARTAVAEAMTKPDPTADLKVINGQLVNVRSGAVQGDYRDPEKPATSDDIREYQFAKVNDGYTGGFQDWMADQRGADTSAAEDKINRITAEYGVDRRTAVGIVDGVLNVSRHPLDGSVVITDLANNQVVTPQQAESTPPPGGLPERTNSFEGTNPRGAVGVGGAAASLANTILDSVGLGQAAPDIDRAQTAMDSLATRTVQGLSAQWPGRPSNLTREMIESMTVRPGDFTTGPGRAANRVADMQREIERAITSAHEVASSQGKYSKTQIAEAQAALNDLLPLYQDYIDLGSALGGQAGAGEGQTKSGINWSVE